MPASKEASSRTVLCAEGEVSESEAEEDLAVDVWLGTVEKRRLESHPPR